MATIAILGAGDMGTALCTPLAANGHDVRLWGTHLDRDIVTVPFTLTDDIDTPGDVLRYAAEREAIGTIPDARGKP